MSFKYCKEGHVMDPAWKTCPVCLAPLAGWLLEMNENRKSERFFTIHEGKCFLGSGVDCEVRILNKGLCRQQAYMSVSDGICSIVDLGNGKEMKVNNIPVTKTNVIDGDEIMFGDSHFKIKLI